MATNESDTHVGDTAPVVELVTCEPVATAVEPQPLPGPPDTTPTRDAQDATIGRTGADPPPEDES